jgi:pimeloyl-ACP methyl ester carboxylesterase
MHFQRQGFGKPLVLVHGLGSSLRTWDPVLPALSAHREVIAVDLPGFGETPALPGRTTFDALTHALEEWLAAENLGEADLVGSSMGARLVMELARRGHPGTAVALDPGGFWDDKQVKLFGASVTASFALVRRIQPLLPALTANPVGRTALLAQFSAAPWKLPKELVLRELRGFTAAASPSLDDARRSLIHGSRQEGAPAGSLKGKVVIGWGRQDRVTVPGESVTAVRKFPDASLHWFERCGHFPHWDQPKRTVELIDAVC